MNPYLKKLCIAVLSSIPLVLNAQTTGKEDATITPTIFGNRTTAAFRYADSVMKELSTAEKLGQMIMVMVYPSTPTAYKDWQYVVKNKPYGGVLWQKGDPLDVLKLTNFMRKEAKVPMMVAMDGEWGLSMRFKNTIQYPRNMLLGAISDLSLIKQYGMAVAEEAKKLGIHVSFAPVLDVNNNPQNPVINTRSFGSSPANVTECGIAYARGIEESGLLSCAKHFPGHGDTNQDSHNGLPCINVSRERLDSVELAPFSAYIRRGLGSIMIGHLDIPALGTQGVAASLSKNVVTTLLQKQLGFAGLIFTDALNMKGANSPGGLPVGVQAFLAGNDILLAPTDPAKMLKELEKALQQGVITKEEVDRRCRKILAFKYALNVQDRSALPASGLLSQLNEASHQKLRDQLYLEGMTLVHNHGILPINIQDKLLVIKVGASSGRTLITAFNSKNTKGYDWPSSQDGRKKIISTLDNYDKVMILLTSTQIRPDRDLLQIVDRKRTSLVVMTSPYEIKHWRHSLKKFKAIAIGYEATIAAQKAMAKVLKGEAPFKGNLSADLSLYYAPPTTPSRVATEATLPQSANAFNQLPLAKMERIRKIAQEGIAQGAYPGCRVLIAKHGHIVYNESFGFKEHTKKEAVELNTLYDLASMTKALVVTPLVMMAVDDGKLALDDAIGKHLPWLNDPAKRRVTISDLLAHTGGMPASIPFYLQLIEPESYTAPFLSAKRKAGYTLQVGQNVYAQPHFRFSPLMVQQTKSKEWNIPFGPNFYLHEKVRNCLREQINATPLKSKRYRYSDIDFLLLQQILENVYNSPLDSLFNKKIRTPLGLHRTLFIPLNKFSPDDIAEGMNDTFLRKGFLRGFVDDETAAILGGVAGSAGLFGTAGEVAVIAQMLLNGGVYQGVRLISERTVRLFTTQKPNSSAFGLGFDRPRGPKKQGNTSNLAPMAVYGHTGFTGTCFWVDPDNEWILVFLSNRGCPQRWNPKLSKLEIRKRIQEVLYL